MEDRPPDHLAECHLGGIQTLYCVRARGGSKVDGAQEIGKGG